MLAVTAYDTHAEVRVLPNPGKSDKNDFYADLNRLKKDIKACDRKFDQTFKVWIITNIEAYADVSYIYAAMELRKMQPELF